MPKKLTPPEATEWMRSLLAFILIGAFISFIPLFVFKTIADESREVIVYMVGQLSGMATTVLGFYFVSKAGQDSIDAQRTDNTGKALDAIKAAQKSSPPPESGVEDAVDAVAGAAEEEAERQK